MILSLRYTQNFSANQSSNVWNQCKTVASASGQMPRQAVTSAGLQQDTVTLSHSRTSSSSSYAAPYHRQLSSASDTAAPNGYLKELRSEPASSGTSAAEQALARLQFDLRGLDLSVEGSFGAEKLQNRIAYITSCYTTLRQTIGHGFPPTDSTRTLDNLKAQIDAAERKIASSYSELLDKQQQTDSITGTEKVRQSALSVMAQRTAQCGTNQAHTFQLSKKLNQYV